MKFLLKFFCLLSLLISFSFSEVERVKVLNSFETNSLKKSTYEYSFLKGKKYLNYKFSEYDINVVRPVLDIETYYILDRVLSPGYYGHDGNLFLVEGVYKTGKFSHDQSVGIVDFSFFGSGDVHNYTLAYLISLARNDIYCKYSENPGIKSQKCFPACSAGQSWDIENEVCYSDCSDKNLNKFGYSNGTAQGGCVYCSNALSDDQIMRCACSGFGSSYEPGVIATYPSDPSFKLGNCESGIQIRFKSRLNDKDKDKDKKKDNNSTNSGDKDKENPKPDKDKDKKNDNNSTNSSNKDNKKEDTKPNKKDNNENSNNSSGENSNFSNNNSGGSAGNGSSGGGGTGVETKPNPNYNGNGKGDGKQDGKGEEGKGEEGKGDDAVAQKLDYGDLEKDSDKFNSDFKGALDSVISQAQDFKNSLNDTISKIKEGGLAKFNQSAIPNTCPLTYNVDFSYFRKDITFDICKVIAPASQTLYYFFYVVFFVLFLIVTIKLFLFIF